MYAADLPGPLPWVFFSRFFRADVHLITDFDLWKPGRGNVSSALSSGEDCSSPLSPDACLQRFVFDRGISGCRLLFTDGSKIPGLGVGCSVISEDIPVNLKFNLSDLNSIFEAEAIAVLHALRIVRECSISNSCIISDSLSVLSALSHVNHRGQAHQLIHMIREILYYLHLEGFYVTFVWIPGHEGFSGNEKADTLAKEGAGNTPGTIEHSRIIFPTSLYGAFREEAIQSSLQFFYDEAQHRGYRYFNKVREKSLVPWFQFFPDLSRSVITLISRIRSHHVALAAHLHNKGLKDSDLCACGSSETIQHAFECARHGDLIGRLKTELTKVGINPSDTVIDVAFGNNSRAFQLLKKFVREAEIII